MTSNWPKLAEVVPNAIDYYDGGCTGTNSDRPDLQRLLNDTQAGDRVLVWKLDWLARNLRLLLDIEDKLREMKVPLISISEYRYIYRLRAYGVPNPRGGR